MVILVVAILVFMGKTCKSWVNTCLAHQMTNDELQAEITKLEKEIEIKQQAMDAKEKEIKQNDKKLKDTTNDLEKKKAQIVALVDDIHHLQQKVHGKRKELEILKNEEHLSGYDPKENKYPASEKAEGSVEAGGNTPASDPKSSGSETNTEYETTETEKGGCFSCCKKK